MTNKSALFEPWANLTFPPFVIGGNPPEPPLSASTIMRIRALKTAWKDAFFPSDSQPSVLPPQKEPHTGPASNSTLQSRSSPLKTLPFENLLQITSHLPLHSLKSLAQTSHLLRQTLHSESAISFLQQAHPTGDLVALYLLTTHDLTCTTHLTCATCLTRHPLSSFHPHVASHHVTTRSCTAYLRAFHRARGAHERWERDEVPWGYSDCRRCGYPDCGIFNRRYPIVWNETPEEMETKARLFLQGWEASPWKAEWRGVRRLER